MDICAAMEMIVKSTFIRASCVIRSLIALLAIIATFAIFKIHFNYMLFHINARMLLYAYILWNFLLSSSLFLMNTTDVIR